MEERVPRICVFAPSPILTVTVEDPVDSGDDEIHLHAGGQGYWIARMVSVLDVRVCVCSPIGGETGELLAVLMRKGGLELVATPFQGANAAYVHDRRGGERAVVAETSAPALSRHDVDDLYNSMLAQAFGADAVVLAGSGDGANVLAPEIYTRLSRDLVANNITTIADLSGDELRALEGVDVLKVSADDLVRDGFAASHAPTELATVMRDLATSQARNVIVSRAGDPAIALVDGELVEVLPPTFEVVDHHGAGDSMTAALSVALAGGSSMRESLRLAAAAGALNVTRHGLGSGRRDSIEALCPRVEIRPLALEG